MSTGACAVPGLAGVDHIVVLMLENRSFDHLLGVLYAANVSPAGNRFEGLTGTESCPGSDGDPRTNDPLAGIKAPPPPPNPPNQVVQPSHLQEIQAALIADHLGHPADRLPLETNADYDAYIREHGD